MNIFYLQAAQCFMEARKPLKAATILLSSEKSFENLRFVRDLARFFSLKSVEDEVEKCLQ